MTSGSPAVTARKYKRSTDRVRCCIIPRQLHPEGSMGRRSASSLRPSTGRQRVLSLSLETSRQRGDLDVEGDRHF
jgi:hypothetical protein